MPFGIFDPTWAIVIPGILLAVYAQYKVMSTYNKYAKVEASSGMTAGQAARRLLDRANLSSVKIEAVPGHLSDHYDPRSKVLRLSAPESRSLSAIGVAAHETGHALQDAEEYHLLALRSAVVPVAQFAPPIGIILFMIGLIFWRNPFLHNFMWIGIAFFAVALVFALITLPVEFDASSRAIRILRESGVAVGEKEIGAVQKVLSAAALTYVAAALVSALEIVRFLVIARSNDR